MTSMRILALDHSVNVEREWDRGVAEFLDSILRDEASRHPDLEHVFPEGADIGDDIDVSRARLLGH